MPTVVTTTAADGGSPAACARPRPEAQRVCTGLQVTREGRGRSPGGDPPGTCRRVPLAIGSRHHQDEDMKLGAHASMRDDPAAFARHVRRLEEAGVGYLWAGEAYTADAVSTLG